MAKSRKKKNRPKKSRAPRIQSSQAAPPEKPSALVPASHQVCDPNTGEWIHLPVADEWTNLPSRLMMGILRLYKRYLSPVLGAHCRFTPTCSVYAMGAFKKHGFFRGVTMTMHRLLRCNPFFEGGYDPP